jgi:hypothetical protein
MLYAKCCYNLIDLCVYYAYSGYRNYRFIHKGELGFVSDNGIKRLIAKSCALKLASHRISNAEIKQSKKFLNQIRDDKTADPRTRFMAARFLMEHDFSVYQHENPPVEKIEHSGNISIAAQIEKGFNE